LLCVASGVVEIILSKITNWGSWIPLILIVIYVLFSFIGFRLSSQHRNRKGGKTVNRTFAWLHLVGLVGIILNIILIVNQMIGSPFLHGGAWSAVMYIFSVSQFIGAVMAIMMLFVAIFWLK
jgi:hypothetical protein